MLRLNSFKSFKRFNRKNEGYCINLSNFLNNKRKFFGAKKIKLHFRFNVVLNTCIHVFSIEIDYKNTFEATLEVLFRFHKWDSYLIHILCMSYQVVNLCLEFVSDLHNFFIFFYFF